MPSSFGDYADFGVEIAIHGLNYRADRQFGHELLGKVHPCSTENPK
jgi:hypothetical protein